MSKSSRGMTTTLLILLILSANAYAQRLPPDVVISNPQVFEVTITTKFVVPEEGKRLTAVGGLARVADRAAVGRIGPDNGRIGHYLRAGKRAYPTPRN